MSHKILFCQSCSTQGAPDKGYKFEVQSIANLRVNLALKQEDGLLSGLILPDNISQTQIDLPPTNELFCKECKGPVELIEIGETEYQRVLKESITRWYASQGQR